MTIRQVVSGLRDMAGTGWRHADPAYADFVGRYSLIRFATR